MASAPNANDGSIDRFLEAAGHEVGQWEGDGRKKRCPDCGGVNASDASNCAVCGWRPGR